MLDPVWNAAEEAQALNRAHRIGQVSTKHETKAGRWFAGNGVSRAHRVHDCESIGRVLASGLLSPWKRPQRIQRAR